MNKQFTYQETTPEEVAPFNKKLEELGEEHGFVLAPVAYITKEGKVDANIHIFKKVELVPKEEGVPSPFVENAGNDSDKTENGGEAS